MARSFTFAVGLGVLAALAAFAALPLLEGGGRGGRPEALLVFLGIVAIVTLPGAALLALPLTLILHRKHREGASRRRLFVGALTAGPFLGLVNLLIVGLLLSEGRGFRLSYVAGLFEPRLFLMAVSGGLGLGFGCWWGLPRTPKEAA